MSELRNGSVVLRCSTVGVGPTLLFTHGWGATSSMFEATARSLSQDFRVITWDLRGHGGSDSPDEARAYSVDASIADMVALLDAGEVERAVLVGHSLGGYLSLEFARRHPRRVAALVLVGTGPGYRSDGARDGWNRFVARIADRVARKGLAALDRERPLHGDQHRSVEGLVASARGVLPQHDDRVIASLPSIDVPTLVIVGEDDAEFRASGDYMATKIPAARLVVVPDAAHSPNLEQPEAFERAMLEFLATLDLADATPGADDQVPATRRSRSVQ